MHAVPLRFLESVKVGPVLRVGHLVLRQTALLR